MTALHIKAKIEAGAIVVDVDLRVDARGLVLAGPNGAGKTTLLLAILGIRRPQQGRITLGDQVFFDHTTKVDQAPELRRIAYLPQDRALFPHMTAVENVVFAINRPEAEARDLAAQWLAKVGLDGRATTRRPRDLSGGEQQRVAIARALAANPTAVLLDEPLGALDAAARPELRQILVTHLRSLGCPFIFVTHDPQDARACDAPVAILEKGQIVQQGPIDDIRRNPAIPYVSRFLDPQS